MEFLTFSCSKNVLNPYLTRWNDDNVLPTVNLMNFRKHAAIRAQYNSWRHGKRPLHPKIKIDNLIVNNNKQVFIPLFCDYLNNEQVCDIVQYTAGGVVVIKLPPTRKVTGLNLI